MKTTQAEKVPCWNPSFSRSGRVPARRRLTLVILAWIFLGVCAGWSAEQAYTDAVTQTKLSFHWDHTDGALPPPQTNPVAQVATTARAPLTETPNSLTTINYDAGNADLYKQIGGTNYVLVSTYTRKTSCWVNALPDTPLTLVDPVAGYKIFPWVSAGSDLKNYFAANYSTNLTLDNVDRLVSQTLGMPDRTGQNRVLAFFWAPIADVLRPAYSADISTQISYSGLQKPYGDNSYAANSPPAGTENFIFEDYNNLPEYTGTNGFSDFMTNNEARTTMPWTAMGYTYNWNYLEDGQNGRANDPFRVDSYVGTTEFVVSAGDTVVFDHFENDLYSYLVPEPGSVILLLLGAGVVCFVRLRRMHG
jgi:hypothetical protein